MKLNIKKELHAKSVTELRKRLLDAREEQRVLRLDKEMGKLKNTSSLTGNRIEIAVISTILNEKLAEAQEAKAERAEENKVLTKDKPAAKAEKKSIIAKVDKPVRKDKVKKGGKNE